MKLQRAIGVEDKEERRQEILDAAESLYLKHPDRIASVAEVAEAAGLAKGTVYLYFPSKEEMLLALHERHVAHFFTELMKKLASTGPIGFDDIFFQVTLPHLIRGPGYLALTSRCFGMMDREVPLEAAIAFKARVAQILSVAGAGLERHFPLGAGGGVKILLHSYGLIVGLWQLLHPNDRFGKALERPELRLLKRDYEHEIETALRALWSGTMGIPMEAKPAKGKKP